MTARLSGIRAVAFDAYGTLFDVASPAERLAASLGDRWRAFAELWRAKQLQYTWLRSLAGRHADFFQVTGDALDFALDAVGVRDIALRERLLGLYERLDPYPDARQALARLRASGLRLAILSNGAPNMLESATRSAGLADLLDAILSVEEVRVFKPHPLVYRLAVDRLGVPAESLAFVSSNGWDAFSAQAYGLRVAWCNRAGQPRERIPAAPEAEIRSLAELPDLLGA